MQDGFDPAVTGVLDEAIRQCGYQLAFSYPSRTFYVSDDGRWAATVQNVAVYSKPVP